MAWFLLDTNELKNALDRDDRVRARIFSAMRAGHRVGTCIPVLCELHAGIAMTARREQNKLLLEQLTMRLRIWPLERDIAAIYGAVFQELRSTGRALSPVDIMIASLCRRWRLTLVTSDRDFDALPDISTENWLAP